MKNRFLLGLVALGAAVSANAADAPLATQPLATPAPTKSAATGMRKSAPPSVSETSVTRQADGSLAMNCVQKPNPKLKAAPAATAAGERQP